MAEKLIVGKPVYQQEEEMYETKVGLDDKGKTLRFSAWGETEQESITLALQLQRILNAAPLKT